MTPVKISDIVEGLEMQFDELTSFLDKETGHVETVSHEMLHRAEEADEDDSGEDLPEWQRREYDIAKLIVPMSGRFLRLPSKFDVHEWQIMADFASSVENDSLRDELLSAIHGRGAFRYFKDVLHRRGMKEQWYEFRTQALREIAVNWLEEHGVSYARV